MSYEEILLFDGAARGNPGPAGAGFYLAHNKIEGKTYLGYATNNQAEYEALKLGLERVGTLSDLPEKLIIKGDSQLIIKQLRGDYQVKSPNIRELYEQVKSLIERLMNKKVKFDFVWIPREQNTIADRLANQAINER